MGEGGLALEFCKTLSVIFSPQLDRSTREVELGLEYGTPTMNLAGQSLKFENGHWVSGRVQFSLLWSEVATVGWQSDFDLLLSSKNQEASWGIAGNCSACANETSS